MADSAGSNQDDKSRLQFRRRDLVAPKYDELKGQARRRHLRGGPDVQELSVALQVVTPIFGGSAIAREIDMIDGIRVPSIRGQLRYWWRALYSHHFENSADLHTAEASLWGRASPQEGGGRSSVEIVVDEVNVPTGPQGEKLDLDDPLRGAGAYALWPARRPPAARRSSGTRFKIRLVYPQVAVRNGTVIFDRPISRVPDGEPTLHGMLVDVVRAWILFGGYGSRTRRGLGSLTAIEDVQTWLPPAPDRAGFAKLFGKDFSAISVKPRATAQLPGSEIVVGAPTTSAEGAWTTALGWLREFRQDPKSGARKSGTPQRPSISNWPEADKIRQLSQGGKLPWAHRPRYDANPAWPRAGFGLPIGGQFQRFSRQPGGEGGRNLLPWEDLPANHPNHGREPSNFELRWHDGQKPRDRLASPLTLKALALANGQYVPAAIWLNRAYPDGKVFLKGTAPETTGARFDEPFSVPAGIPRTIAQVGATSLREAFLSWLAAKPNTSRFAP